VLKPGGTLVIACWCQREETPDAPLSPKDKEDLQFLYDEWAHPYFISYQEFERLMQVGGQRGGRWRGGRAGGAGVRWACRRAAGQQAALQQADRLGRAERSRGRRCRVLAPAHEARAAASALPCCRRAARGTPSPGPGPPLRTPAALALALLPPPPALYLRPAPLSHACRLPFLHPHLRAPARCPTARATTGRRRPSTAGGIASGCAPAPLAPQPCCRGGAQRLPGCCLWATGVLRPRLAAAQKPCAALLTGPPAGLHTLQVGVFDPWIVISKPWAWYKVGCWHAADTLPALSRARCWHAAGALLCRTHPAPAHPRRSRARSSLSSACTARSTGG
jgi:hypothetical protein